MNILGFSHLEPFANYFHGTSVCLVQDNSVRCAIAEERFTRIPQYAGYPACALNYILAKYGLGYLDIDAIALPWPATGNTLEVLQNPNPGQHEFFRGIPVIHVNHQTAHAYSAFAYNPFASGYILTLDGMGFDDDLVTCGGEFSFARNTSPVRERLLKRRGSSLGEFYGAVTTALGWTMLKDEGKTMALAGFASANPEIVAELGEMAPRYVDGEFIGPELEIIEPPILNGRHNVELTGTCREYLRKLISAHGKAAIAAAAQKILEHRIVEFCQVSIPVGSNVCLAGGVFLNIHVNRRLREVGYNVFTYPNPGDGGTAVGAALWAAEQKSKSSIRQCEAPVYLGPDFSAKEIEGIVSNSKGITFKYSDSPVTEVTALLLAGKVVGIFQGRAEWGPRALGNRSVFADPTQLHIKERLNLILKKREGFQPFGAIMTRHGANTLLEAMPCESSYMFDVFHVREEVRDKVPAIVHADGTVRPQILQPGENSFCEELLISFGKVSGIEALLNTSLNLHGEAMCLAPSDAIHLLQRGGIDILYLSPFMVRRQ